MGPNPKLGRLVFVLVLLLAAQYVSAAKFRTKSRVRMRTCKAGQAPGSSCPLKVWVPGNVYVTVYCRKRGEDVYGDPWWVSAYYQGNTGWISDAYIDCGGKVCNVKVC